MQAEPGELAGCRGPPVSARHRPRPGATTSLRRKEDPRPPPSPPPPPQPDGSGCPHLWGLTGLAGPAAGPPTRRRREAPAWPPGVDRPPSRGSAASSRLLPGLSSTPSAASFLTLPRAQLSSRNGLAGLGSPTSTSSPAAQGVPRTPHPHPRGAAGPQEATRTTDRDREHDPRPHCGSSSAGRSLRPPGVPSGTLGGPRRRLAARRGAREGQEPGLRGEADEAALPDLKFISSVVKR